MTLDEMWARLAQHQPYADKHGYGPAWATMCKKQTAKAAFAACAAADAVDSVGAANAAGDAAWAAADAVDAVGAANAAGDAAWAVDDAAAAIRYIENAEKIYDAKEPTK
jgi:hypothetical protein